MKISFLRLVLSGIIGIIFSIIFLNALTYITKKTVENDNQKITSTIITQELKVIDRGLTDTKTEEHNQVQACLQQYPYEKYPKQHIDCYSKEETGESANNIAIIDNSETNPKQNSCLIIYFCLSNKLFIQVIYFLQFLALTIQATLTIYILLGICFNNNDSFFKQIATWFSKWAIDSPPVLGVIGTIYAFSYAASVDSSKITAIFKATFTDAAFTTIVGGSVFVVNLALAVVYAEFKPNK